MNEPAGERRAELERLIEHLEVLGTDPALIDRALTHASAGAESGPSPDYEALEFLGDAALGLAIAHRLYLSYPGRTPGEYSRMRAQFVNQACLARIAKRLDIAPIIRLGKGEEQSGGRQRSALLADCVEALIGAVYLDQGWETARAMVERIYAEELQTAESSNLSWDYKSRLQHFCQARRMNLPEFVVIRSEGPDHRKQFEVEVRLDGEPAGRGTGATKKEAGQNAAKAALETHGQT